MLRYESPYKCDRDDRSRGRPQCTPLLVNSVVYRPCSFTAHILHFIDFCGRDRDKSIGETETDSIC